jgi:NADPH2:quinone reductase
MKAIRVHEFGGPDVLRLEETAELVPGPKQVRVKIKAIGINPVDVYIHGGSYGQRPLPYTPGSDAAGVIEWIGDDVYGLQIGQRVYTTGTLTGAYAEKALCRPSQVQPLPDRLTFAQGAAIHVPYYTAYYALHLRAGAKPGETVLVHGASGGVGLAAVQIAHALGMTVIGTAGSDRGRDAVKASGADHVLDHTQAGYLEEVKTLTGGKGPDIILEMLANVNLAKDLGVVAQNGRVVIIGSRGPVEIDPRLTMQRNSNILGMSLMNATDASLAQMHAALGAGFANGSLSPVVGSEYALREAPQAHEAIMEPGAAGKIVLLP